MSQRQQIGIYWRSVEPVGVTVEALGAEGPSVVPLSPSQRQEATRAVVGAPANDFMIQTVPLPGMSAKEAEEAGELQLSYHVPGAAVDFKGLYHVLKSGDERYLLLLGVENPPQPRPAAIVPAPLSAVALARFAEESIDEGNVMILVIGADDRAVCCVCERGDVVFFREFRFSPDNLNTDLRLMAQATYLPGERRFITIDRTIAFSERGEVLDAVANALGDKENASVHDASEWVAATDDPPAGWLVAAGLAMLGDHGDLIAKWSVHKKPTSPREKLRRIGVLVAIFALVGFPLYQFADAYAAKRKTRLIDARLASLSAPFKSVSEVAGKVTRMERFLAEEGREWHSPETLRELFNVLDACRPYGVWYTNATGKVSGAMVFNGRSRTATKVSELIKNLSEADGVVDVRLNYTNATADGLIDFQLVLRYEPREPFPEPVKSGEGSS